MPTYGSYTSIRYGVNLNYFSCIRIICLVETLFSIYKNAVLDVILKVV